MAPTDPSSSFWSEFPEASSNAESVSDMVSATFGFMMVGTFDLTTDFKIVEADENFVAVEDGETVSFRWHNPAAIQRSGR
ncbi:MAG: hypothetical protein IH944_02765 [Armatimonadetes bacterium]|nr:hypothetical protein [Armatimonadota bacterium]